MKITDLFAPFADELQLLNLPKLSNPPLIEWTSGWGDLFFRVKGADVGIVWCVLGRGAPDKRPLSRARLATLNKYVSRAYAGRTFFRVVPFAAGDDWALVRTSRALVKSPVQRKGAIWRWGINIPVPDGQIKWFSQPLEWFENWLRENADTELQAAREFARLSDHQRQWIVITRESETPQKWETLMPALQKLGYSALDPHSATWHRYGHNINAVPVYPLYRAVRQSAPITELAKVLQEKYPLDYRYTMWRGIGVRGKKADYETPSYKATVPSQHEKLEAALLWRDFGREIGESARVEATLAQLLAVESSE